MTTEIINNLYSTSTIGGSSSGNGSNALSLNPSSSVSFGYLNGSSNTDFNDQCSVSTLPSDGTLVSQQDIACAKILAQSKADIAQAAYTVAIEKINYAVAHSGDPVALAAAQEAQGDHIRLLSDALAASSDQLRLEVTYQEQHRGFFSSESPAAQEAYTHALIKIDQQNAAYTIAIEKVNFAIAHPGDAAALAVAQVAQTEHLALLTDCLAAQREHLRLATIPPVVIPTPNPTVFSSATITSTAVILPIVQNIYSTSISSNQVYMGGWLTPTDTQDRIFSSSITDSNVQTPEPIQWNNHPTPGVVPDFLANDPSVVQRDNGDLLMYYTGLPLSSAMDANPNVFENKMFRDNIVRLATSTDGGQTWDDQGTVIPTANGLDQSGAWSPSALIKNDEIWVYSHTNLVEGEATRILRSRLDISGQIIIDTQATNLTDLTNIDIKEAYGSYWLTANNGALNKILLYRSEDGMNFTPFDGKDGVLIEGAAGRFRNQVNADGTTTQVPEVYLLTPSIDVLSPTNINITFAYGNNTSDAPLPFAQGKSIHTWNFELTI